MITGKRKSEISGFERYEITTKGDIRILESYDPDYDTFGTLSKRIDRAGYYTVRLFREGKLYTKYLHRLLAEAFISNPHNHEEVNHKNGCKLQNNLENLEWVCHRTNVQHAYDIGLTKKVGKKVIDTRSGATYKTVKEAAIATGVSYSTCKNYLNGNRSNPTPLKYIV